MADGKADETDEALLRAFASESRLPLDVLDLDGALTRLCLPSAHRDVLNGRLPGLGLGFAADRRVVWRFGNILHSRRPTRPRLPASSAPGWLLDEAQMDHALTESLTPSSPEGRGHLVLEDHGFLFALDGQDDQVFALTALTDLVPFADGAELQFGFDSHLVRGVESWFLAELVRLLKAGASGRHTTDESHPPRPLHDDLLFRDA